MSAKDENGRLLCGAAVGITANVLERVDALVKAKVDVIVIDSAHGHSANIFKTLRQIKAKYPDLQVIAGNVATGAATRDLIEAGADAVKVGIGPGSICTTRVVAGIGVPQITAVMDCYNAAKEDTVFQLIGGLRSGMGYCGAKDIETLKETGKFVKISAASLKESHPHDIHITKEAPNYSIDE